jgi:outer membrane protein insertion porin family/translocation and assembly module TamA
MLVSHAQLPAASIDELEAGREWRVEDISISGNSKFSRRELLAVMLTRQRPWYRFWEDRPIFDPVTFTDDLERLRRFYEARGYYQARISYELEIDRRDSLVKARIEVVENQPVIVSEVLVQGTGQVGAPPPSLPEELPIRRGEIFTEEEYQKAELTLKDHLLNRGFAHVETSRRAEVDLSRNETAVRYTVDPGPPAVFGETIVEGTKDVEPRLVLRELTYSPGELFSFAKVDESRAKILGLDLFSAVKIAPRRTEGKPQVLPMEVEVIESPPRELRAGIGYGTEDEFRAQIEWRHNNWLGGGRRLSFSGKYSAITLTGEGKLIQPHFLSPRTQAVLSFRQDREDEETYLLNATRFQPRLEHRFSKTLTAFVGYRAEYHDFSQISPTTVDALGGIRRNGVLSGPSLGLIWNTTDDPFTPKKGEMLSLLVDQAGEIWGGQFAFYKIAVEGKKYLDLGWETVLANRIKIGFADALGERRNVPLSERFFSGGEKSVRGFGRRKLGPRSESGDPIGGLSLIEGSLELRRPLWGEIGGSLFLDFGQVSTGAFDLPVDDLEFSSGFGVSYNTPVGPIRLDIGFPFKPPRGERPWQIHFSIGAYF